MKILTGFLNYNRDIVNIKTNINKLKSTSDCIVVSNQNINVNVPVLSIQDYHNVAYSKNLILKYAKDNNYDYCVIIEDDIIVSDKDVMYTYINLLNTFKLDMAMWGCSGSNMIFNTDYNPAVEIRLLSGKYIYINRNPTSSFMIFKVYDNMLFFNDQFNVFEVEEYLTRAVEQKTVPFLGMYLDIYSNQRYIKRDNNMKTLRVKSQADKISEFNSKKINFMAENNLDTVILHIKALEEIDA